VKTYKYLGLEIDQDLQFKEELIRRKKIEADGKKKQWIFSNPKLSDQARYEVWQSLFKSKASYAAELLCFESKKFNQWMKGLNYRGMKKLLKMNPHEGMDTVLEAAIGQKWECWLTEKLVKTRTKMGMSKIKKLMCGCELNNLEGT
jgi:hypothetical protein